MWLDDQVRPEEERNRYPRPRSDADIERPSPFVSLSSLVEVLDDVGALKREEPLDPATLHALLHTPPPARMVACSHASWASTSTPTTPPAATATSSPLPPQGRAAMPPPPLARIAPRMGATDAIVGPSDAGSERETGASVALARSSRVDVEVRVAGGEFMIATVTPAALRLGEGGRWLTRADRRA